jgi:zinc transport system substrate-binding protein
MKGKPLLFIAGVVFVLSLLLFVLLSKKAAFLPDPSSEKKLSIVTTLYPLYDFARNIGGNKVDVILLLPPGVEPHAFEPKPSDIVAINRADLFIYTGNFMERWVANVLEGISNNKLKVIDASSGVTILNDKVGVPDPHIWLDFENVKIIVDNIASGLAEKDQENQNYYLANASLYKEAIDDLDKKYSLTLADCKSKEIIYGGHYAFGYLSRRYNIDYLPVIEGVEPESEPTAGDIDKLVERIKRNGIKYIFYEELTSPKIAEIISKETKANLLLLNAVHNVSKESLSNASFISMMENNLRNIKTGLECR